MPNLKAISLQSSVFRKVILGFLLLVSCYLLLATSASAQDLTAPGGSIDPNIKAETLPQFVVNGLFVVAAFLAVLYLMYGGVKWITSRGDKVQVEAARKHIVAAIIGLVIVMGSFFTINVVFNLLGDNNPLKGGFTIKTLKDTNN